MPNYTGFLLLNEVMFRTDRNRLTNLDTNVSVYLGVCELLSSSSENIGHPQILSLILAVLSQAFPCHHDRHRRLGNKVVTERAKQHTATVSQSVNALAFAFTVRAVTYPLRALRPLEPRMTRVGSSMSIWL